jgi:tellurite resistance protein
LRASILEYWTNQIQRLRGRGFLDAAMAAAALVSTADEDVRLSEQYALDHLVQRMDELRLFDPHAAVDLHRRYVERIEADSKNGRREAIGSISSFRGDEEKGLLVLYVGAVVAKADGDLSEPETQALAEIATALGLPAKEALDRIWGESSKQE